MKLEEFKQQMLASDQEFYDAYYSKDLKYNIGQMLREARMIKGKTQGGLAREMGTKQPSIARVENGTTLPSLKFLAKVALALGTFLVPPVFGFMRNFHDEVYFNENSKNKSMAYVDVSNGMEYKNSSPESLNFILKRDKINQDQARVEWVSNINSSFSRV